MNAKSWKSPLVHKYQLAPHERRVRGVDLEFTEFDLPVRLNSRVLFWIDYFCGKGREHFETYLRRSQYFIPFIRPILREKGMPEDLVYLSMIESGFNNLARSRARAVGPWQFMTATGQRYGLMVNWWVDERRDIRKSTLAAVDYLKDLYQIFQSWELAAAAYNAGETKVARAVRRFGSTDFWTLSRQRFLKPETRDYVPKMIAAAIIAKNAKAFGFPSLELEPAPGEALAGDGELVKVFKTDMPLDERDSSLSDRARDLQSTAELEEAKVEVTSDAAVELVYFPKDVALARSVPTPHMTKSGEVNGEELLEFEVQSPADLLQVAKAAGLSYHTIKSLNPEILRWCTPPAVASYKIKLPSAAKDSFLQTYNHLAYPKKVSFLAYRVKSGETLQRIAKHFGIKVDPLAELNGLSPRKVLHAGAQVLLPIPTDRTRTLSSLDLRDPPDKRRKRSIRVSKIKTTKLAPATVRAKQVRKLHRIQNLDS